MRISWLIFFVLLRRVSCVGAKGNSEGLVEKVNYAATEDASSGSGTWVQSSSAPSSLSYMTIVTSDSGQNVLISDYNGYSIRSSDFGETWTQIGAYPQTRYAAGDSNAQNIVACSSTLGAAGGGVSVSVNYGASFTFVTPDPTVLRSWAGVASDQTGNYVFAVACYFKNAYGVEYPSAVYSSANKGITWGQNTSPITTLNIITVACSGNGQTALFGTYDGLLYQTTNAGASWAQVIGAPAISYDQLVFATNSGYVYAVNYGTALYKSADFGLTWAICSSPSGGIAKVASDSTGQYLIAGGSKGLFTSADFGASWVLSLTSTWTWAAVGSDSTGLYLIAAFQNQPPTGPAIDGVYINNAVPAPTLSPTTRPTQPSALPTARPTAPTSLPTSEPTSPTSRPSSQPSSSPSCTAGSAHSGEGGACSLCVPGEYISAVGGDCQKCPQGKFSTIYGARSCRECPFPTTTVFEGQTKCTGYSVYEGPLYLVLVLGIFTVLTLLPILLVEKRLVVLVNLLFPTLDVFSDMAYLLGNDFYNPTLFYACVLFIVLPVLFFIRLLVRHKAPPRIHYNIGEAWWLKAGRDGDAFYFAVFPIFANGRFPVISCAKHDNLAWVVLEAFVWVIAIGAQVLTLFGWIVFALVHPLFIVLWFALGCVFYLTKTITIGGVWNFWFGMWTASDDHATTVEVDTHALNSCLQHEFYFETMPQVVIQLVNTFLLRQLSSLAIISLTLSFAMAINGVYKYVYYRWLTDTRMLVEDIPIDMSIRFQIAAFGIDWTILDAKLEPMRKEESGKHKRSQQSNQSVDGPGVALGDIESSRSVTNPIAAQQNTVVFTKWLTEALRGRAGESMSNAQAQHCAKCFLKEGIESASQFRNTHLSAKYLKYMGITNVTTQAQVLSFHESLKANRKQK